MLHFVVVSHMKKEQVGLSDPARGLRKLSLDEFSELWTGYVVNLRKTPEFVPGNHHRNNLLRFGALLNGQYARLLGVLLLSLVISAVGIVGAFAFQLVIGESVPDSSPSPGGRDAALAEGLAGASQRVAEWTSASVLGAVFGSLIALYVVQAVIQVLRGYLIFAVSKRIDIRLLLSYFNHVVDLPVSSSSLRTTGEYMSRFSDAGAIRAAISGVTVSLVLDATMVIGCGIILYLQSGPLFWVALVLVILYVIVLLVYRKPIEKTNRTVMESNSMFQSFLKESIDGAETVKAAGAGDHVKQKAEGKFLGFANAIVRAGMVGVSQEALSEVVQTVGTVVVLWLGFSMVASGEIGLGTLITFYALLAYFVQPIKNLVGLQPEIQTALVAADRLNDVLDLQTEGLPTEGQRIENVERWDLADVRFRYGNGELVLRDASLTVKRGERVAIVGASGSGKTTLAKLLLRFYSPESGRITADGIPVEVMSLSSLRDAIAYVDQNTFLFADSIKNNLTLGNVDVTDEEIRDACRASHADGFIAELPMGLDTPLDENGMNLSGGQRQRLAIARALLKRPQLLILDEATSSLDTITEAGIRDTVFGHGGDLTCILIAHRLTTIQECDRIYVMDRGRVIEQGSHEELVSRGGEYARLWDKQRLGKVAV